jgi:hypothetical protein
MESQRKRIDTPGLGASEVDSEEEFDSETIVVNDNVETSPVPEEDTYNGFWLEFLGSIWVLLLLFRLCYRLWYVHLFETNSLYGRLR